MLCSCNNESKLEGFSVAKIFGDNMVLQQESTVPVWGKGYPGELVRVEASWDQIVETQVDTNGDWEVVLKTPSHDGFPKNINLISKGQIISFKDVLLGEVWLASGQSNMEWPMAARIDNQRDEILNANYSDIRFFKSPLNLNNNELKGGYWEKVNSESVKNFSAVGYFFAQKIRLELNVPVGIIVSAWGGTRVEAWTSLEKLAQMTPSSKEALEIKAAKLPGDFEENLLTQNDSTIRENVKRGKVENNPNQYSILFETMIKPLIPFRIKGVLWYQGESNVSNFQDYQTLFSGMISDWRDKWNADLPFHFVQIAPYKYDSMSLSQALREAQRKTLYVKNTGMAITMDIGEERDIHPANKQDVGHRLARLALVNNYNFSDRVATGPLFKNKKLFPKYIDLSFEYIGDGLVKKNHLEGFEIAAANGIFFKANATIVGDYIRVESSKVKNPQRVRYAWKNYFSATLFNSEGLPASSFDTN